MNSATSNPPQNGSANVNGTVATPFANGGLPAAATPKYAEPPKYTLTLDEIATYLFYAFMAWLTLLYLLFRPSLFTLFWYLMWGTTGGAAVTYLYFNQLKRKEEIREVLSFDPGLKGLKFLCGELPSWLSLTEREKVNWLNSMLAELWPFYDKAVCDMVKAIVEPMMDQMKPPGLIKSIKFKNLTFGTAPFRIEDMLVMEEHKDEVLLEVNIRWAGDANITMAVDLPAGGDLTRMCPKITDMSFMGTARISLRPLIDTIPCFGFAMVSFRKPPLIKYKLDFGKALGGSAAANGIKNFIEPFIEDYLVNAFVWPNRQLFPIAMTEDSAREMAKLQLRDVGVMRVKLSRAKNLKSYDMNGKSDPTVTLWIDPLHKRNSKVCKSTLEPDFGDEAFYLLVQEPKDQYLRMEMFDVDFFNAEKLGSSWKVWNSIGKAFNAKTHMGRCMINVKNICATPLKEVERWYPLGKGEWGDDDGPGKGEGEIYLKCTYVPFSSLTDINKMSTKGVLNVKVSQCSNVVMIKGQDFMTLHLVFKCNKEVHESQRVRATVIKDSNDVAAAGGASNKGFKSLSMLRRPAEQYCSPVFNAQHTFYDVDVGLEATRLKLKLMADGGALGTDDELGRLEVDCRDIRQSRFEGQHGRISRTSPLQDSGSDTKITYELIFIPYF